MSRTITLKPGDSALILRGDGNVVPILANPEEIGLTPDDPCNQGAVNLGVCLATLGNEKLKAIAKMLFVGQVEEAKGERPRAEVN